MKKHLEPCAHAQVKGVRIVCDNEPDFIFNIAGANTLQ